MNAAQTAIEQAIAWCGRREDFGFWIADFGLKTKTGFPSSDPKSRIHNSKSLQAIALATEGEQLALGLISIFRAALG